MKYRDPKNWTGIEKLKGLLFFVQRLEELTYAYTLDSYKTPTTSIHAIIDEAMRLLRDTHHVDFAKQIKASDYVLAELRLRLKGNWVARSLSSLDVDGIMQSIETSSVPTERLRWLSVLSAEMETEHYLAKIVENVISLAESNEKKNLDFLAREMASLLQSRGMSRDHINRCIVDDFYSDKIVTINSFKPFCQRVYPHHHKYRVLLGLSSGIKSIDKEVLLRQRILAFSVNQYAELTSTQLSFPVLEGTYTYDSEDKLENSTSQDEADGRTVLTDSLVGSPYDDAEDEDQDKNEDQDKEGGQDEDQDTLLILDEAEAKNLAEHPITEAMAIVHSSATDYHSAVKQAISTVESVFNNYRLFNHKANLKIAPFAVAEQACCDKIFKRIDYPDNAMHFIRDMRSVKASSTMRRFSERILLDVGPDENKFQNLVNIHGMSLSSPSDDIQLVNLWTCLETMAPASPDASKVSNVVSRMTPIITLGYFNRIVSNLLFDILRWNRRKALNIIKESSTYKGEDLKGSFYEILSSTVNNKSLQDLLSSFGSYELLRYRVFEISALLKSRSRAIKKLQRHEKMVTWQLHRIYRTRNSIVHSGESPSFTPLLVENAHDFFDQGLLFCLEVSAWKRGFDTFVGCFDYAKAQASEYVKSIENGSNSLIWTLPKHNGRSFIFDEVDD